MAIRIRTKRLATSATNPRRVSRRPRSKNPKKRKMSDKQIRHFGTKAQKAALKRRRTTRSAPARVVKSSRGSSAKRSPNPAWIVTVGQALNPKDRRRKAMAKPKTKKRRKVAANRPKRRRVAKSNPRRRTRRKSYNRAPKRRTRRRNSPKVVIRYRTRKRNGKRRTVSHRNPDIFGARLGSKDSIKMIGGGIAGVAAAKFLPTLLPANMLAGVANSNLGKTAISLAAALVAGYAASKLDARFGQGVYFGGIMQAASVGLNAFLPSLYKTLNIGMAGIGDFVPAQFAVPQNPIRGAIAAPVPAHAQGASGSRVTMSGLARAYAPAY